MVPLQYPREVFRSRRTWLLLALACSALAMIGWTLMSRGEREIRALIDEIAGKAGVDPALVDALVWRESGYDSRKIANGGYGLMQLGKGVGMEWAAAEGVESFMVTDLLDARTNLQAGCWYLDRLLDSWRNVDDPVVFALAEYYAGPEMVAELAGDERSAAKLLARMELTHALTDHSEAGQSAPHLDIYDRIQSVLARAGKRR